MVTRKKKEIQKNQKKESVEDFELRIGEQMQNGFQWSLESWSIKRILKSYEEGILQDPDYQREKVWDNTKNKALIDTIVRYGGNKIPTLTFRRLEDNTLEIVDGKQRILSAIVPFCNDEFGLTGVYEEKLKGYTLSDIKEEYPIIYGSLMSTTIPVQIATDMSYDDAVIYFIQINNSGVTMRCGEQIHAMQGTPLLKTIDELISHKVWDKILRLSRFNNHEYAGRMILFARDKKDSNLIKTYTKHQLLKELEVYYASEIPRSAVNSVKETFDILDEIFTKHNMCVTITEFYSIFIYANSYLKGLNISTFGKFLSGVYSHIHNNSGGVYNVIKYQHTQIGFKYTSRYYHWYIDVLNMMYTKFMNGADWNDIGRLSIKG